MLSEYLTVAKTSEIVLWSANRDSSGALAQLILFPRRNSLFRRSARNTDATHNVYAYIVGINAEQQKCYDDGEPSGSSGLPTLEAIAMNLTNVVVVVTRYFGGILLGRGGLIRAYGSAAAEALKSAGIVRCVPHHRIRLTVGYPLMGKVQKLGQRRCLSTTPYMRRKSLLSWMSKQKRQNTSTGRCRISLPTNFSGTGRRSSTAGACGAALMKICCG